MGPGSAEGVHEQASRRQDGVLPLPKPDGERAAGRTCRRKSVRRFVPLFLLTSFCLVPQTHSCRYIDLSTLILASPLTLPSSTVIAYMFRFHLTVLVPLVIQPQHDWATAFAILSHSLSSLTHLDLSHSRSSLVDRLLFPSLASAAQNLRSLFLPHMQITPSTWRVAMVALLLYSLKELVIKSATPSFFREILPYFAGSPLRAFGIEVFPGTANDGEENPVAALIKGLESWPEATLPRDNETPKQEKLPHRLKLRLNGVDAVIEVIVTLGCGIASRKNWQLAIGKSEEEKRGAATRWCIPLFLPTSAPSPLRVAAMIGIGAELTTVRSAPFPPFSSAAAAASHDARTSRRRRDRHSHHQLRR